MKADMTSSDRVSAVGRGAQISPPNRFQRIHVENAFEQLEHDEEFLHSQKLPRTEYFSDDTQTIVTKNDSPDVGFTHSIPFHRYVA